MIKSILLKIRIKLLKRKARRHYTEYRYIADQYSCGHNMLMQVSAAACHHAAEFNAAMNELADLDTKTPTKRL